MTGLILTLGSILAIYPPAAEEPFHSIGFEDACKQAKEQNRVVLIDFYTTWCGPCKRLDRVTWADADVKKWLAANTVALKLDAEKETKLAERYRVDGYPTILLLKPDGTEIDRLVGYREPEGFLSEVKAALAGKDSVARAREKLVGEKKNSPLERFQLAQALEQKGKKREALDEYLWCYDHGMEYDPSMRDVRMGILPHFIAQLGQTFPPALLELKKRRDQAEKAALNTGPEDRKQANDGMPGVMGWSALEFAGINEALGEDERTLAFFDRISKEPGTEQERQLLLRFVFDALLDAKRYEDILSASGGDPVASVAKQIERFNEFAKLLSKQEGRENAIPGVRKKTVSEGAKYYEALLGAKKQKQAETVAAQLVKLDPTSGTFVELIDRAKRAGDDAAVNGLVRQAETTVHGSDLKNVRRAAGEAVE